MALKKLWERSAYTRADGFVVLSHAFADLLHQTYGVPTAKIFVIRPGVDLQAFSLGQPGSGAFRVVCVRRLQKRMGLDVLLRAWQDVVAARPDARLDIVGEGPERLVLQEMLDGTRWASSVVFRGRLPDAEVSELFRRATVSVVPSTALEGFGLIALESLASGTPCIVSRCGGLPEGVSGLDESLIVAPGDAIALAERLLRAAAGDLPSRTACRGYAEAFTWSSTAKQHVELYGALLR